MLLNRLPSPFNVLLNVEFHEFFGCEILYKSSTSRLKRFPLPPLLGLPCPIVSLFLPSRIYWLLLPSLLWRSCCLLWCFLSSENRHLNVYSIIVTQSNYHNYCSVSCQIEWCERLMPDMYDFENHIWLCHSFGSKCFNYTAFVTHDPKDILDKTQSYITRKLWEHYYFLVGSRVTFMTLQDIKGGK